MRKSFPAILTTLSLSLAALPATAQTVPDLAVAKDLLLPCQEADNDPRDGFLAELECLTYIRGFVAGVTLTDARTRFCFPEANREDAVRRAYVRWVHAAFAKRGSLPVGAALLAALDESFGCQ